MPSPTPRKCRGSVVRQLSLQNQTCLQSQGDLILKRQLSEDDGRILHSVEVTGQGWPGIDKPDSAIRIGFGESRIGQSKIAGTRPKPVKVAWPDKKQEATESSTRVEVVATKCQSQPRPLSIRTQRFRNPLVGNKDTLVYTRLQLAERLRNAWSERDKTKPNLNIFLARAPDAIGPCGTPRAQDDDSSTRSEIMDRKQKSMNQRIFSQNYFPPDPVDKKIEISTCGLNSRDDSLEEEENENSIPKAGTDYSVAVDDERTSGERNTSLRELNRIEVRLTKNENTPLHESLDNKVNFKVNATETGKESGTEPPAQPITMTAKERRANFRSSSILHKTITDSFACQLPCDEGKPAQENPKEIDVKSPNRHKVLTRALSAPSHDHAFQKQNIPSKMVKFHTHNRLHVSFDSSFDASATRERIKSAPTRRKLKTAAARRKSKDRAESSSEDEKDAKGSTTFTKKTTRRARAKNGSEIITMVSLVSPAESDTEDSVINLPINSFRTGEIKEDTVDKKSTKPQEQKNATFVVQKFVTLRKIPKTVSFQSHPTVNKNYSASFPSRRAPSGTPLIIPSPAVGHPALTPAQLQERDKRPPICGGAADGRGVKRRLIRFPSEPPKEETSLQESRKPSGTSDFDEITDLTDKTHGSKHGRDSAEEPELKCPKERECWTLYKKMLAKGVSVSFDTVLRGMLTPTEYRLRKNRLLSFY